MNSQDTNMSARGHDDPAGMVRCDLCLAEVSLSVARSFEGLDYVRHFCGLNCLEKWQAQSRSIATSQGK